MGIPQALGENGGPGGLFHAMRMIPGAVAIAQLVDEVASPGCIVLNLTNPLSRICTGILQHSDVNLVGLCHEIHGGRRDLSELLDLPRDELRVEAAGLNHFTWFTKIEDSSGADLYPRLVKLAANDPTQYVANNRLITSDLFRATGVQCVTDDSHAGEYLRWGAYPRCAWAPGMSPNPFFQEYRKSVAEIEARVRAVLAEQIPLDVILGKPSGEELIDMVAAAARGERYDTDALNVRNDGGFIPELPAWAVVEVPGHIDANGGHGHVVDSLPDWVMALCSVQVRIHRLTARAAMDADRQAGIEALIIDPSVPSIEHAEAVFDALLEAHRAYLPRWQ
jgi:alpha-galactosidase